MIPRNTVRGVGKRDRKEAAACVIKEVSSMSNWKLLLPGNSEKWCKTHFTVILWKGKGSQGIFGPTSITL